MAVPVAAGGGVIGIIVLIATMLLGGGERGGGGGFGNLLQDDLGAPAPESREDEFVTFLSEDTQAVWADILARWARPTSTRRSTASPVR